MYIQARRIVSTCAVVLLPLLIRHLAADELITLNLESKEVLEQRLEAGDVPMKQRQSVVQELFSQAGCTTREQAVNKKAANVICRLPGELPATIIIGAHYDYAPEGHGIVDDWSGTVLLATLYRALKTAPRKHTFQFVAFAAEELGLVGSQHYVKQMTAEEIANTRAVINLECLGLTPPKVWLSRATPSLLNRLLEISDAIHVPIQGASIDKVGDDDTHSFLNKKMPVLTIHSITSETWAVLHSKRDNISAIRMDDYQSAYRLVAFYLAYLDAKLP